MILKNTSSTHRARSLLDEPFIYTVKVKYVVTFWKHPYHISIFKLLHHQKENKIPFYGEIDLMLVHTHLKML